MTIYDRIKKLREEQGLSQQTLAEKVGFKTASAVNKIELGLRDINQTKIMAFAEALNVSPAYLMGWEDGTVSIKRIGKIKLLSGDKAEIEIDTPQNIVADSAIQIKGDSLKEAHINDGDIVYILQCPTVENGQLGAVLINDEVVVRKIYVVGDTLTLVACNSNYEPLSYSGEQLNNIHIIGRVVGYTSRI